MSQEKSVERIEHFNLIGTSFVKMYREYLISTVKNNKGITESELIKMAWIEKNVKPETTRKYIKELLAFNMIELEKD